MQGLMMDTISRLRCVQLKCGTDCVCVGTTVDTICGNAVANSVCACVCVCVWSPLQSIALKSSSSEKAQLIMILLRYTIYALSIYIDEFESYQSQFDVCLICMCGCMYLSICVYSLCVGSLCACVCVSVSCRCHCLCRCLPHPAQLLHDCAHNFLAQTARTGCLPCLAGGCGICGCRMSSHLDIGS